MRIIFASLFASLCFITSATAQTSYCIQPVTYDINQTGSFTATVDGSDYHNPTPYTPHTLTLWANAAHNRAVYATWRIIWSVDAPAPGYETAIVRLYKRTPDASAPKVAIAWKNSSTMVNPGFGNVSNDGVDVTAAFNAFLDAGAYGHFGWDFAGDNSHPVKYWAMSLEVGWKAACVQ